MYCDRMPLLVWLAFLLFPKAAGKSMSLAQVISSFIFTLTTSVNELLSSSVKKHGLWRGKCEYHFEQTGTFQTHEQ